MTRVLVVSGTGTGIGVVKPAQTGTGTGDVPDTETVRRLTGLTDTHELARFPDPLSPEAAARVSGLPPLDLRAAADYVARLAESRDLVLAPVAVVAAAGLGTLNHTALTLEALAARKLALAGVVIGSWPRQPGIAELANLTDLQAVADASLAGVMPEGAGGLDRPGFLAAATAGLAGCLGGRRASSLNGL